MKALTMSYDDGIIEDRRLVEIFNRYGIKGTFHLNSGLLGNGRVNPGEVATLYHGHEVSCHGCIHASLDRLSHEQIVREMWEDRKALEKLTGYPVRGMSYAYGQYNRQIIGILQSLGFVYARNVASTQRYNLPGDFMAWEPTCHHKHDLDIKLKAFKQTGMPLSLMYVWGHSSEFKRDSNWGLIENFCAGAAGDETVWYASNIEIYDYLSATRRMEYSVECNIVKNPNAIPVWISSNGEAIKINPGEVKQLY
jgi:hypothetical protein